jgi:hypothetical protein
MVLPVYGPPLPPHSKAMQNRRSQARRLFIYVISRVILHLMMIEERAQESYVRGRIRAHFRAMHMDRYSAFLDAEFIIIFRMSRRSMEQLRHELYPFLRVHLTEAQIEGRAHGNRRPLTVDEKLAIGLMTAGGCPLSGILWGFHLGRSCAYLHIIKFFEAVVLSRVGEIKFPSTLRENIVVPHGQDHAIIFVYLHQSN